MPGSLPPASAFLGVYGLLGTAVSFGLGRAPGSLPADPVPELWLSVVAVCVFLVYYSIVDVYEVARVKQKVPAIVKKSQPTGAVSEEFYLAQRAQTNQVEQLPGFLATTALFSVLVNGRLGGFLSLTWAALRMMYSRSYRSSTGVAWEDKGLYVYTAPCYFIINTMSVATLVHMLRFALAA